MNASFGSAGRHLSRLMDSVGLPREVSQAVGAALESKVNSNPAVARDLFNSFSMLATASLDKLLSRGLSPQGVCTSPGRTYARSFEKYASTYFQSSAAAQFRPFPVSPNQVAGVLLNRSMNQQSLENVIRNLAASMQNSGMDPSGLLNPNAGFDAQFSQLIQGLMGALQVPIQNKLGAMAAAVPAKRKKKKKGIGGKLKKGIKKIGKKMKGVAKGIASVGKNLFKGVVGGVKGLFKGNFLKGLSGMILKLGGGLLGGLVGGPMGSSMIQQIAQAGISKLLGKKKAASLEKMFGQMTNMFNVVNKVQKGSQSIQAYAAARLLR